MKSKKIITLLLSSAILTASISFIPYNKVYAAATTERLQGTDRYGTAIAISKSGWQTSENVILATGADFPDALSATPLAKQLNAPILLIRKTLDSTLLSELNRLQAKNVFIVGGQGVISEDVENSLQNKQFAVTRISGDDRYDTSLQVADYIAANFNTGSNIVVATGENFPDALSIAPIAAAKGMPIILTKENALPDNAKLYITEKKVTKALVVGGNGAVSDTVLDELPAPERISGSDRYETNVAILNRFANDLNFNEAYIATGGNFPDALAGSALASSKASPIILTGDTPETVTSAFVNSKLDSIGKINVLGGEGAVKSSTYQKLVLNSMELKELLQAVNNTINIRSMEGTSTVGLKVDAKDLPQGLQDEVNTLIPLINSSKINITTKSSANDDQSVVKSSTDISVDSALMPLEMSIWINGDFSKETPDFNEIVSMPSIMTDSLPAEFAGKDYMTINSEDLTDANTSTEISDYNDYANIGKEFQGQLSKFIQEYLAEPSSSDFIMDKGQQSITTPDGTKNAEVYEVTINNELLKQFLSYTDDKSKDLNTLKDLNLIGNKGIVLTYYVSDKLIVEENAVVDLHLDLDKLSAAFSTLGLSVTSEDKLQGAIEAELDMDSKNYNINKDVTIDMPVVNDSNSVNFKDLLNYTPGN